MAQMVLVVPDSQVTRVLNAIWANHHNGELPPDQATAAQHAREWLYSLVRREVTGY